MTPEEQFEKRAKDFCNDVEDLRAETMMTYVECIIDVCSKYNVEIEDVKAILSKPIHDKLLAESMERNLLAEKFNTLF